MKLNRMNSQEAEKIIVYGVDKGFSMFTLKEQDYTVYHRVYNSEHYDILEMTVQDITLFYLLDHNECITMFGGK